MFGGIGGALKGLSTKAEEMIEKTKTSVGEIAAEKKAAAAAMIEAQTSKTKDALFQTKTNVEGEIVDGANEAKAAAIEGFDRELASAEQTVQEGVQEVSQTVDTKMKEADQFVDQKREEVIKTVQDESQKATSGVSEQLGSVLGKAKGLLNF